VFKVICISGKAQNGKSETANWFKYLYEGDGKKVAIVPFARDLKQYLSDYYGFLGVKSELWRSRLQEFGQNVRENVDEDFFATRTFDSICALAENGFEIFICDDMRYVNELEMMKNFGENVEFVRVNRSDFESILTPEQKNHQSEVDLDDYNKWDYYINCESGIENIRCAVKNIYERMNNE